METLDYMKAVRSIVGEELFDKVEQKHQLAIRTFPASTMFHHCEVGGYMRHIWEVVTGCIGITESLAAMQSLAGDRSEKFDIDSLLKVAFIHDLDKLTRYELDPEEPTAAQAKYAKSLGIVIAANDSKSSLSTKIDNAKNDKQNSISYYRYKAQPQVEEAAEVLRMCSELGIMLTREEAHCICYHHGGWSTIGKYALSPMATILHSADLISAKVLG